MNWRSAPASVMFLSELMSESLARDWNRGVPLQYYLTTISRRQIEMTNTDSRVTIHMAASLDGFIARKDGSVDWLETSDTFEGGNTMTQESAEEFLRTIDCYVM